MPSIHKAKKVSLPMAEHLRLPRSKPGTKMSCLTAQVYRRAKALSNREMNFSQISARCVMVTSVWVAKATQHFLEDRERSRISLLMQLLAMSHRSEPSEAIGLMPVRCFGISSQPCRSHILRVSVMMRPMHSSPISSPSMRSRSMDKS